MCRIYFPFNRVIKKTKKAAIWTKIINVYASESRSASLNGIILKHARGLAYQISCLVQLRSDIFIFLSAGESAAV